MYDKNLTIKLSNILSKTALQKTPLQDNVFLSLKQKNIIIYGAGAFGRLTLSTLVENGIKPLCFLDINYKNIVKIDNIFVNNPENNELSQKQKESAVVLIAISLNDQKRQEIEAYLNSKGYKNVRDAQELQATKIGFDNGFDNGDSTYVKIEKVFNILADEKSKEVFVSCLEAHFNRDYTKSPKTSQKYQYFDDEIPFTKGFDKFIDCGAYTGDTLNILCEQIRKPPDSYIGFEPDLLSYEKLEKRVCLLNISQSILMPCAVSDIAKSLFYNIAPGASSVGGNDIIQCVGIDQTIKGFAPTFIKMDIEGAEISALIGAKNTIKSHKPELAICVYHAVNHYWDIAAMIDSWRLGYKFYMRTYSGCCMETVLYGVM